MQSGFFSDTTAFCSRKSATNCLCVKIFGDKVVRHSLQCLIVHK